MLKFQSFGAQCAAGRSLSLNAWRFELAVKIPTCREFPEADAVESVDDT